MACSHVAKEDGKDCHFWPVTLCSFVFSEEWGIMSGSPWCQVPS